MKVQIDPLTQPIDPLRGHRRNMNSFTAFILIFPVLMIYLFGWLLSGVIHELGHAIVGKMAGLNITYITIWPPGVGFSAKTSNARHAAISIAGPLFSVLVGVAGTLVIIPFKEKFPYTRYLIWLFLPMMMHSLTLLFTPIARIFGIKAPNEDVTKFIELTECPPLAVSLIGLTLVGLSAAVFKWAF